MKKQRQSEKESYPLEEKCIKIQSQRLLLDGFMKKEYVY